MLRSFAHPVACCWMLLRIVAQSLKPVKLFSQQLPTFLLFRDRRSVTLQCWIHFHSSSNIVGATHVHYAWFTKSLWVVSFPRCTAGPNIVGSCCIRLQTTANTPQQLPTLLAQQCWELLHPFAHEPLPTRTQQLPTLLAQHCWELLHPFAHHCQHARNNSQHCWRNNVGSCCVRLFAA